MGHFFTFLINMTFIALVAGYLALIGVYLTAGFSEECELEKVSVEYATHKAERWLKDRYTTDFSMHSRIYINDNWGKNEWYFKYVQIDGDCEVGFLLDSCYAIKKVDEKGGCSLGH